MKTFIQSKLEEQDDNVYKEIVNQIQFGADTFNVKVMKLEYLYNQYMDSLKDNEDFNEKKLIKFLKKRINVFNQLYMVDIEEQKRINNANIIVFKAYLSDHPEMNCEIKINSYITAADFVYSVLAAFHAYCRFNYHLQYNDICYEPGYYIKKRSKNKRAEDTFIDELCFKVGDKLILDYDSKTWVFNIEILEVLKQGEVIFDSFELIKKQGRDILDDDREMFDALLVDNLDKLNKVVKDSIYYNYILEYYHQKNWDLDNSVFNERISDLQNKYEFSN